MLVVVCWQWQSLAVCVISGDRRPSGIHEVSSVLQLAAIAATISQASCTALHVKVLTEHHLVIMQNNMRLKFVCLNMHSKTMTPPLGHENKQKPKASGNAPDSQSRWQICQSLWPTTLLPVNCRTGTATYQSTPSNDTRKCQECWWLWSQQYMSALSFI